MRCCGAPLSAAAIPRRFDEEDAEGPKGGWPSALIADVDRLAIRRGGRAAAVFLLLEGSSVVAAAEGPVARAETDDGETEAGGSGKAAPDGDRE